MSAQRPTLDEGRRVLRHRTAGASAAHEQQTRPPMPAPGARRPKVLRWAAAVALAVAAALLAGEAIRGTLRTMVAALALFGLGIGILLLLIGGLVAALWLWRSGRRLIGGVFGIAVVMLWLPAVTFVGAAGFSSYAFDDEITSLMAQTPPTKRRVIFAHDGDRQVAVAAEAWAVGPQELRGSSVDDAIISIEDREFETRLTGPLDLLGKVRGLGAYAIEGRKQGGSSIDEQLAKFVRGRRATGVGDYFKQDLLAARLVWLLGDRDQVLARYANLWEVRPGRRGIPALAFDLFGVTRLNELSLSQSAMLAGMLRSPAEFDPRTRPAAAMARRDLVLNAMVEAGRIDAAEAMKARQEPIVVVDARDRLGLRAVASAAAALEEGMK